MPRERDELYEAGGHLDAMQQAQDTRSGLLREHFPPLSGDALSVRCPGCNAQAGSPCLTVSGYELRTSTHDIRQRDLALARARAAERAHAQMVECAGRHRDEADRFRAALQDIAEQDYRGNRPWSATRAYRALHQEAGR